MAANAAYRHECIAGKQLPKARKQMSKAQLDELKAIIEQEEDKFAAYEGEIPDEMSEEVEHEMKEPDVPKLNKHV